jgi:phage recombination protein Bet
MTTNDTALAIWTPDEVKTIRSVIAPTLDDAEFLFFAQVCRAAGLNPIMNQIHAIKRKDSKAPGGSKLTIQTSIHGLRLIADRTKCYAPGREPTFVTDGRDILSATAYVKKYAGGQWHEVADTAYWTEYVQTYPSGDPIALWATKPHVMLAKCAEALALRRAFPAEMAGLYTDDEMPDQEPAPPPVVTQAVASTVAVIGGADPRQGAGSGHPAGRDRPQGGDEGQQLDMGWPRRDGSTDLARPRPQQPAGDRRAAARRDERSCRGQKAPRRERERPTDAAARAKAASRRRGEP